MTEIIEYKVQTDPWTPWEELPVAFTTRVVNRDEASDFGYELSKATGKEVRWSYTWSNQGHYENAKHGLRG